MGKRPKHPHRHMRNMTLAPRTEALMANMARRTGIARGRLVDLAIDLLEICDDCQGTGTQEGPLGPCTEPCSGCAGTKVRPVDAPKPRKVTP